MSGHATGFIGSSCGFQPPGSASSYDMQRHMVVQFTTREGPQSPISFRDVGGLFRCLGMAPLVQCTSIYSMMRTGVFFCCLFVCFCFGFFHYKLHCYYPRPTAGRSSRKPRQVYIMRLVFWFLDVPQRFATPIKKLERST